MIQIYKKPATEIDAESGIAANSLDTTTDLGGLYFVKKSSDIVSKVSAATDLIAGVAYTQGVFASDNQTVAKKRVEYYPAKSSTVFQYGVTISGGTITVADEGKFYNLSDAVTVDGTTENSTTVTGGYTNTSDAGAAQDPLLKFQLKLVKFVTATYGIFEIVTSI